MKTSKDTTDKTTKKYWAFISYRHADNLEQDRDWASWLHKSIETYDVPAELIGTKNDRGDIIPERIYPVFRDEESLPADADLANSITNALDSSNFLVALCSPRAVESKYVAQEIEHFKATGKGNRIIAAIIAGEPGHPENECFPEPIREVVNQDGKLSEPIAADFRRPDGQEGFTSAEAYKKELLKTLPKKEAIKKAEKYDERLQLMKLKILAGILGVPLETIRDRDKAYQLQKAKKRQQVLTIVISTLSLLVILASVATFFAFNQKTKAEANRIEAEEQTHIAKLNANKARKELNNVTNLLEKTEKNIEFLRTDLLEDLDLYAPKRFSQSISTEITRLVDSLSQIESNTSRDFYQTYLSALRGYQVLNKSQRTFKNLDKLILTINATVDRVIKFHENNKNNKACSLLAINTLLLASQIEQDLWCLERSNDHSKKAAEIAKLLKDNVSVNRWLKLKLGKSLFVRAETQFLLGKPRLGFQLLEEANIIYDKLDDEFSDQSSISIRSLDFKQKRETYFWRYGRIQEANILRIDNSIRTQQIKAKSGNYFLLTLLIARDSFNEACSKGPATPNSNSKAEWSNAISLTADLARNYSSDSEVLKLFYSVKRSHLDYLYASGKFEEISRHYSLVGSLVEPQHGGKALYFQKQQLYLFRMLSHIITNAQADGNILGMIYNAKKTYEFALKKDPSDVEIQLTAAEIEIQLYDRTLDKSKKNQLKKSVKRRIFLITKIIDMPEVYTPSTFKERYEEIKKISTR